MENLLMNMIELDYIDHELNFTNSGIEYMLKNHREFINKLSNIDTSMFCKLTNIEHIIERSKYITDNQTVSKFIEKAYGIEKKNRPKMNIELLNALCNKYAKGKNQIDPNI